jgi:hypothetical protein
MHEAIKQATNMMIGMTMYAPSADTCSRTYVRDNIYTVCVVMYFEVNRTLVNVFMACY